MDPRHVGDKSSTLATTLANVVAGAPILAGTAYTQWGVLNTPSDLNGPHRTSHWTSPMLIVAMPNTGTEVSSSALYSGYRLICADAQPDLVKFVHATVAMTD